MKKFNAIDLFCGAGGLSLGFQQAGFNIIVGVDNEQAALDTFEFNHKGAIGLNADLSKRETFDLILKTAGDRKIDVVIAGPPCQGFSLTGPRNFDDPRNKLYLAVIEMVKQYNPKGFIIENVPGMANMYKGQVKDEVLKRFRKMGYNIDCRILKACDYGVPQMRKRLVFMGVRKDIGNPHFPDPTFGPETKKPYRTCRDAISDLPTRTNNLGKNEDEYVKPAETEYQVLMRDGCSILYNHIATNHKQFVKDTIALVPEGGNYKDLPEGVGNSRNFHMAWTRLDGNAPARTVDTGHRNLFHYELNRVPTVRESARIQSFPDNFVFNSEKYGITDDVVAILITRPDLASGKDILNSLEYYHFRTGHSINFYLPGYGAYWTEEEYPDGKVVTEIAGVKWSFSNQRFVEFIEDMEKYSKWRYSGESDLIFAEVKNGRLSYERAMEFHLDNMLRDKAIISVNQFFEKIVRIGQEGRSMNQIGNKLGIDKGKQVVFDALLEKMPMYMGDVIKQEKYFCVKNIQK